MRDVFVGNENHKENRMSKTPATKYNFTFNCGKSKEPSHVDGALASFRCPDCGLALVWDPKSRKLGAHRRSEETVGHTLRVAQEL
jgi:predicted RNA-binding Zn-ribbon protein involved in translation (DUF1610 family)